jgi:hypothetical protein
MADNPPSLPHCPTAFNWRRRSQTAAPFAPGDAVHFVGTLLLDHYIWVEYLASYSDPPDLFYNLRVARIRRVGIPDEFVSRHDPGKALPTRVAPANFGPVEKLSTMEGQPFDEEVYVIDFDDAGMAGQVVPRTFR